MSENIQQWNKAAEAYAGEQEHSAFAESNRKVVRERFPGLNGERILDLGCGYGWYTDYFRSIGGNPVGVDGAGAMIDIAKRNYPDCAFITADITKPLPFESGSFDLVFCNQVLMDLEDVESVLTECFRVLKRGGIFYLSIVHPAFYNGTWETGAATGASGKLISSYLTQGTITNRFWGETKHFHRPLSYYLNAIADAGFVLRHTKEPRSYDGKNGNCDLPLFFFAEYST
ncbi:MAG: class I SAM-dependent methyltransferase [Lachnospiraceae bacterium]|nr:class I SAM-dependent methyltransferase [Lachnospiraceae bacterium]